MVGTLTKEKPPWGDSSQVGLLFFMATVTMLFAGIFSSLVIRRASPDWRPLFLPKLLWLNTAVLLLSSVTLEFSRSAAKDLKVSATRFWITLTAFLGFGFLAGQVVAWREMAHHGVFLPSSPHASFFYLLTGLHGLHLLGGLLVLILASVRAWRGLSPERQNRFLKNVALYWHYLDALWVLLFLLVIQL